MTLIRKMCLGTLVLGFAFAANVMADDKIKASEFVEEASAKGLAEIETSRIALKESNSSAVRKFAETMISVGYSLRVRALAIYNSTAGGGAGSGCTLPMSFFCKLFEFMRLCLRGYGAIGSDDSEKRVHVTPYLSLEKPLTLAR